MSIKILATANLHLGKSSADVSGDFASTKFTWRRIIDYCIRQEIDVLALCGDIVDWDNRYFEAVGPLQQGFEELNAHQIAVFMVSGNHDFDVLASIVANAKLPNVHLIGAKGQWEVQRFTKGTEMIQFTGWSFPARFVRESAFSAWGLAGYEPACPCIGLLHGDAYKVGSEYHPFRTDELLREEVDLWLIGHIHKPARLRQNPDAWYLGSPHAMSAKEPGEHGAMLIEVSPAGKITTEQVSLSPIYYTTLEIGVQATDDEETLRDRITSSLVSDGLQKEADINGLQAIVYQVKLTGEHTTINEVERWCRDITQFTRRLDHALISVRKVYSQLRPALQNLEELAQSRSPAGILAHTILEARKGVTTSFLQALINDWKVKAGQVYQSATYMPLQIGRRLEHPGEDEARSAILNECNRLLAELNGQIN